MSAETKKKAKWEELPEGATIPESGTARKYVTGGWRSERPVWDAEKCNQCLQCYMFCPDSAIKVKDGKMVGIDLEHCKGCGICARECPKACIEMIPEGEAEEE